MAKQISTEIDHRIAMHYDAEKDICYPISYETQAIDVMLKDGTNIEDTIQSLKAHGDDVKSRSAAALSSIGVKTNSDADWDEVIEHIYDSATVNYNKGYEEGVHFLSNSVEAKNIGQSYTAPHDGFIVFKAYSTVTNHDNSNRMDASIVARYNGAVYKSTSTHIDKWGGGSMSLEGTIRVKKGDTFSCSINVANDLSIGWSTTYTGIYFNTSVD